MKIKRLALRWGGASVFATGRTGHVQHEDSAMATGHGRGFLEVEGRELVQRGVA